VCVPVLAVRFIGAILDFFRGRGYLPLAAVSRDDGQDGVLGSTDLDAGCFVEEGDGAVSQEGGVDAKAAAEESDEQDYKYGEAERDTEQAKIEHT